MKVKKDFIRKVIKKEMDEGLMTETPKYIYRATYYAPIKNTCCYEITRYLNLSEVFLRDEFSEVLGIYTPTGEKIPIE